MEWVQADNEKKENNDGKNNKSEENTADEEDSLKACKRCGKKFEESSFLKHVKHFRNKECKNAYTPEELEKLEIDAKERALLYFREFLE